MKQLGEIEAAVCQGMSRFMQECMGRGPKDIRTHLLGDLIVVRLQGVLTTAEQRLVITLRAEKARDLLKQVRTQLVETARPIMEAMVKEITGIKAVSLHHDISTQTGEEVVLFTLAEVAPPRRQERNRWCGLGHLTNEDCYEKSNVCCRFALGRIASLAYYRGWFAVSTNSTDKSPAATITVDKTKFHEDE